MRRIFGIFFMANFLDFISTIAFLSTGAAAEGNPLWISFPLDTPVGAIAKVLLVPMTLFLLILVVERHWRIKVPNTGIAMMSGFFLAVAFMNFQIAYALPPYSSLGLGVALTGAFVVASCV